MSSTSYPTTQGPTFTQSLFFATCLSAITACGGTVVTNEEESDPENPTTSTGLDAYPPSAATGLVDDGLAVVNRYRALADLPDVSIDMTASEACLGHLRYLAWHADTFQGGTCFLSHVEEDLTNPYYSNANAQAGRGALLACDEVSLSVGRAVDRWVNSLYHRIPVLNPGLKTVGVAAYRGYVCLEVTSGKQPIAATQVVKWPPGGIVDVPTTFMGRENPCPTAPEDPRGTAPNDCGQGGFIVTATWFGPANGYPWAGRTPLVSLVREGGTELIPLLAWYGDRVPGHDPAPGLIPRTVALVPSTPLPSHTAIEAEVGDGSSAIRWAFVTGERGE